MRTKQPKTLLLIGGGGHCHSVLDSVLKTGTYSEIGIIDKDIKASCLDIQVVGRDEDLPELIKMGWTDAFVTVGSVGNTALRRRLCEMIKAVGFSVPAIIDPCAEIANDVQISRGTFVGKNSVINAGSIIGECAIINTGSIIEHDCVIGKYSHISPGAVLCGHVVIGNDCHIGAGSIVRQDIEIGARSLIGMGSVVVDNIPNDVMAFGNPCSIKKRLTDK